MQFAGYKVSPLFRGWQKFKRAGAPGKGKGTRHIGKGTPRKGLPSLGTLHATRFLYSGRRAQGSERCQEREMSAARTPKVPQAFRAEHRFSPCNSDECSGTRGGPDRTTRGNLANRYRLPWRSESTLMSRAAALYMIPTVRHEASAERTVSTAFGPAFAPSNTGGSSPSITNGEFRDASSTPAP
jgi:hypothetical protein